MCLEQASFNLLIRYNKLSKATKALFIAQEVSPFKRS
jgi:hypothetical protein